MAADETSSTQSAHPRQAAALGQLEGEGHGGGVVEAPAAEAERRRAAQARLDLSEPERRLLGDLFAIVSEHASDAAVEIDRGRVQEAFTFACKHHAAQRRKSGEDFIVHPVGVARICASMQLDTETLCAALLHDTVEDTGASIEQVSERFGKEIAGIVDGVTKLTGITFQSHDEAQAENYRKMMMAMADDPRVILIKLADRLHNMRTIDALPKHKQMDKARETLEIYAPLAHRLGIHAIKWELEALASAPLHPRKYQSLHTTVIGPEGRPLEIQIRTHEMHRMAEFGVAAHWVYKQRPGSKPDADGALSGPGEDAKLNWLRSMLDWQKDLSDPGEFM